MLQICYPKSVYNIKKKIIKNFLWRPYEAAWRGNKLISGFHFSYLRYSHSRKAAQGAEPRRSPAERQSSTETHTWQAESGHFPNTHTHTESHQSSGAGRHPQDRSIKVEIQAVSNVQWSGEQDVDDEYRGNMEEPQQQAGRTGEKWWATLALGASQHQGSKTWEQGVKNQAHSGLLHQQNSHTATHLSSCATNKCAAQARWHFVLNRTECMVYGNFANKSWRMRRRESWAD